MVQNFGCKVRFIKLHKFNVETGVELINERGFWHYDLLLYCAWNLPVRFNDFLIDTHTISRNGITPFHSLPSTFLPVFLIALFCYLH